jgi:hypothetical protein
MTASEIVKLLAKRYKPPLFAFFPEFRNATGFDATRSADAVAMGLYQSRGLALHGFEIKVQRADWLRELKDVSKAHAIGKHCDRWWVVAPVGVIQPGEVPDAWGWMEAGARGLRGKTEAPLRNVHPEGRFAPMPRSLVASLVQRAMGGNGVVSADDLAKIKGEAFENGRRHERSTMGGSADRLADLEKEVAAFLKASGISSLKWEGKQVGERLALLRSMGDEGVIRAGERMIRAGERMIAELEEWHRNFKSMVERAKAETK